MEQSQLKKDIYKTSRVLYIIEAALEYFISILVSGAYLAKLTSVIGLSDSMTGILTSFINLGCAFQMVAILLVNKTPVKKWITVLHIINQTFFALIYFIPFFQISKTAKTILFVVFLLIGYAINYVVNSPKINWYMGLVDNQKRGSFTANKEIVSLIGGMLFSYLMSFIIDYYNDNGQTDKSLLVAGITIIVLMLSHTLTLIFSKEKEEQKGEEKSLKETLTPILQNKKVWQLVLLSVIWKLSYYFSSSFFGSYQIKELGFSMVYVSIISIVYAIVRSLSSPVMGRIADKKSFSFMLSICYIIAAISFLVMVFTIPTNGKVFYMLYSVLIAIAFSGINSGEINLIYDEVEESQRMTTFAFVHSISGIFAFLTTVVATIIVESIQQNENTIFGINAYAQQVTSLISFVGCIVAFLYVTFAIRKKKNS